MPRDLKQSIAPTSSTTAIPEFPDVIATIVEPMTGKLVSGRVVVNSFAAKRLINKASVVGEHVDGRALTRPLITVEAAGIIMTGRLIFFALDYRRPDRRLERAAHKCRSLSNPPKMES